MSFCQCREHVGKKYTIKKGIICKSTNYPFILSEWQDSNLRPLAPHASMLANCTTPRVFEIAKVIIF